VNLNGDDGFGDDVFFFSFSYWVNILTPWNLVEQVPRVSLAPSSSNCLLNLWVAPVYKT